MTKSQADIHLQHCDLSISQQCNLQTYIHPHIVMNISNLSSQLKFVNRIGQTLSLDERINLDLAVTKLRQEYDCQCFNFWGRVQGIYKNYYIVEGITFKGATCFPKRRYFWSSQEFKLGQMPQPRREFESQVCKMDEYFTGQHEKIILRNMQDIMSLKHFTELDRLSLLVSLVQQDCSVVPLGAYQILPTHQFVINPNFKGLKIDQSKNLDLYVHFRPPQHPDKILRIQSGKAFGCQNCLDPLSGDSVKKGWAVHADQSRTQTTLRSLIWPGYVGYHRTNSGIYGGVYMGNGIRCQDLPFLI